MDFLKALEGAQATKEWVRFPETDFEVYFSPLSTTAYNRISKTAYKKGWIDTAKLIRAAYPKIILGFKGLTIRTVTDKEKFNLALPEGAITNGNGQPLGLDDPINSDPINDDGLKMLISLGLKSPTFHTFMVKHGGLNPRTEEDYEDEEEHTPRT
jgi:hypothetical protein